MRVDRRDAEELLAPELDRVGQAFDVEESNPGSTAVSLPAPELSLMGHMGHVFGRRRVNVSVPWQAAVGPDLGLAGHLFGLSMFRGDGFKPE